MGEVVDVASLEWRTVRPDVADGVYAKTLLTDGTKVVLTRVTPSGRFSVHQDDYGHLFYFLSGQGLVSVDERQFEIRPGSVVRVAAGEAHAYKNTGREDLMLISINVPHNKLKTGQGIAINEHRRGSE
jgi:mannose-6-phosphate isomerase-like protein (cupin superfamily)